MAPATDDIVVSIANVMARLGRSRLIAISRGSGGTGKKIDSMKEVSISMSTVQSLWANPITHSDMPLNCSSI